MNYANEISLYGMLPKSAIVNTPLTFYKNKSKKEIVSFDPNFKSNEYIVNYMYMNEKPEGIKSTWEWEITQGPFDEEFFELKGKKYKHLRNILHRNQIEEYHSLICKKPWIYGENYWSNFADCESLLNKWWDEVGDKNYGWNVHLGYDKRYLKESIDILKDRTFNLFFTGCDPSSRNYVLRGYAIFSKPVKDDDGLWNLTYMLGKYDPAILNASRMIDFFSYKYIFENVTNHEPFKVNLGTAKGGLLKYKEMVFPTYSKEKRYFYKVQPDPTKALLY